MNVLLTLLTLVVVWYRRTCWCLLCHLDSY